MSEDSVAVFDPDVDFRTIREFGKGVRYEQGGILFTVGGENLGPYEHYQEPPDVSVSSGVLSEAEDQANQTTRDRVRQRAAEKLAAGAIPQEILDAQREDKAAKLAEDNAE